jgi:hypothetical protein
MRTKSLCSLMAAGLFAGVAACGNDQISYPILPAEEFTATLSGAGEVPAVTTAATGTAILGVVNDTILSFRVDVAGIDSTTVSHIHAGAAGVAGPVIVLLFAGPSACKQNSGAPIAITSSSAGNPTTITTTAPHGLGAVASTALVRMAGHAGSTPSLNNEYTATVTGTSTFTVPVAVAVAGTGGTAQRFVLINVTSPRCRPGYTGFLTQGQLKASQLTDLPAGYGATARARLDSLLVLLRTGGAYVNVRNAVDSSGHMRGQIQPM